MTIGRHARGEDADLGGYIVYMTDATGYDETIGYLALCDDDGGVGSAEGDAG